MKIERINRNHKKGIIIGAVITVCLISAITLVTTRAKYRVTQDIKLAKGTVNYKPYDFKIMAMYQQNDSGSYTEINEMPTSGYVVNEEKSYCTGDNKTQVKGKLSTNNNGEHIFKNLQKNDKCYVWFDKEKSESEKVIDKLNVTINTVTPNFSNAATTDEGVFQTEDGMYGGTSYYWRGAVTNNYVKFANKCWRIIRINGDGSIRLIYDGTTCHVNGESTKDSMTVTSQVYNTSFDRLEYVGWTYTRGNQRPSNNASGTASNAKTQAESWFNNNITGTNAEKVAIGKFCNDRNTESGRPTTEWGSTGATYNYIAYKRIKVDRQPTLSCPSGDVYELKIGAITADEAMYAGGIDANNTSYYLYNGQYYYTMSPYYWNSNTDSAYVYYVYNNGQLNGNGVATTFTGIAYGLRLVINLRSDVTFSSGDGTQNNPYVVE